MVVLVAMATLAAPWKPRWLLLATRSTSRDGFPIELLKASQRDSQ